jgi:hypothetical protein
MPIYVCVCAGCMWMYRCTYIVYVCLGVNVEVRLAEDEDLADDTCICMSRRT